MIYFIYIPYCSYQTYDPRCRTRPAVQQNPTWAAAWTCMKEIGAEENVKSIRTDRNKLQSSIFPYKKLCFVSGGILKLFFIMHLFLYIAHTPSY